MSLESAGTAQIRVIGDGDAQRFELRYYESTDFIVPMWWFGVTDSSGELELTAVLSGARHTPADLVLWLAPMSGERVAREMVETAIEAGKHRHKAGTTTR